MIREPKSGERLLVVSFVTDEADLIEQTIHSMSWQSLRPAKWVIVNDGSEDKAGEIVDAAAQKYPWIQVVHRPSDVSSCSGPALIDAFYSGLAAVNLADYDFVVKFDVDVHLPHFYFEQLVRRFSTHARLGAISGKCYRPENGQLVLEPMGDELTHYTVKLFRRECFEEIGGFVRAFMWEEIDCHQCRMLGWEAESIADARFGIMHLRPNESSFFETLRQHRRWGRGQYFMGTHVPYLLATSVVRMSERPRILGGLNVAFGYFAAMYARIPRFNDLRFRRHLRHWQWQRLRMLLSPRRLVWRARHRSLISNRRLLARAFPACQQETSGR